MPPSLRAELLQKLYRDNLASLPIFRHLPEETFNKICFAFKPFVCDFNEVIFEENTSYAREMYVCLSGMVLISKLEDMNPEPNKLSVFEQGSLFGEDEALQAMFNDDSDPSTWEPLIRSNTATAIAARPAVTELAILPIAKMAALSAVDPCFRDTIMSFATRRAARYGLDMDLGDGGAAAAQAPSKSLDHEEMPSVGESSRPSGQSFETEAMLANPDAIMNTAAALARSSDEARSTDAKQSGSRDEAWDEEGGGVGIGGGGGVDWARIEHELLGQQSQMNAQQDVIAETLLRLEVAVNAVAATPAGVNEVELSR